MFETVNRLTRGGFSLAILALALLTKPELIRLRPGFCHICFPAYPFLCRFVPLWCRIVSAENGY